MTTTPGPTLGPQPPPGPDAAVDPPTPQPPTAGPDRAAAQPAATGAGGAVSARVETPRDRYRLGVAALAAPLRDRQVAVDAADRELAAGRRAAAGAVERAAVRVRQAEDGTEAARRAHTQTEREAGRLWREVRAFHGRRGAHLEELPEPERVGSAHPGSALAILNRAERTLAQAKRGELRIEPPVRVWPVMIAAGVLGALVLALAGAVLLHAAAGIHTDARPAVTVTADICFGATPFAGIPLGAWWLSRYGLTIIGWPLLWVLAGGLVAGCALSGWLTV
jgi:hypothetical protein